MTEREIRETEPINFMCSFCLRSREDSGRLVGAPGVGICQRCAQNAVRMLEEAGLEPADLSSGPWDACDDDELLEQLPRIAQAREKVEEHLRHWVGAARGRGLSWASIGESLGMSRQSAWERFHPHVEG
ncbi:MAG: ClpX C4-type zinc finger protein [Flaviflexus sp.]|uniref:ClpX C4-type zinc finger protein n=1 Tax=Flaviflexus sp. TaxID=1969482 RepID=UPI003F8FFD6A